MALDLFAWQKKLEALDPSKIELGLERVKAVFERLSLNLEFKIILVAGTNGKGSAVAVLESLLLDQGASVGAYTSPHLQRFNERARFLGKAAEDTELVQAFEEVEKARGDTVLTYFEFTTLGVIAYFAKKSPDYCIFEVGLGGRLDAVNILDADISVITGVALDHMDWLGPDEESIGYEKAGIYRAGKPAIFASEAIPDTVRKRIAELPASPFLFGDKIAYKEQSGSTHYLIEDSAGRRAGTEVKSAQLPAESILAALTAFRLLGFEVESRTAEVISAVQLSGRYQRAKIGKLPLILDVAHNPQAAEYLALNLSKEGWPFKPAAVLGAMADKPLNEILQPMLPQIGDWYLVRPDIPRAANLDLMADTLSSLGVAAENIHPVGSVADFEPLLEQIPAAVVFGSFYTVGEFLNYFGDRFD